MGFLAILEMARLKMIHIYQPENFGPIRLKRKIEIGSDVLDNTGSLDFKEDYR